jgi:hypothetical protein
MKKLSELPLYCRAGIYTTAVALPLAMYSGIKLLYKLYQRKKIDVGKPRIIEEVDEESNTEIEVNL